MPLGEIIQRTEGDLTTTFYQCSECLVEHYHEWDARSCCMYECEWCGEMYDTDEEAGDCCPYACEYCGDRHQTEEYMLDCCAGTREEEEYRRNYMNPDYPEAIRTVEPEHIVYLPRMDERPMRLCSIEQELSSGGAAVARMLYDTGVSESQELLNYTYEGRPGTIIVKNDGSLNAGGGEVVYGRFNLSDPAGYERVSQTLARIQAMQDEGIVNAGMDAGTHIHISAVDENRVPIGPAQMAGIYEIFSFGEDVIFRMGAAGTPAHRGTRYTNIIPKFRHGVDPITPSKVAKGSLRQRYFSLNFQRLLNAVHGCRCGACVVGEWAECECGVLQNGTVEWRVFNSTTDPEILHAWLLLAHGITAASFTHQLHTLPPHEFEQTDVMLHPWIFGWLLWNCPYQDEERQILFNTARQSPGLALPWENIDEFHEGWGQLEIPAPPSVEADFDNPQADGSFPGCECATCTNARLNQFVTTADWGQINWNASNTQWTTAASTTQDAARELMDRIRFNTADNNITIEIEEDWEE